MAQTRKTAASLGAIQAAGREEFAALADLLQETAPGASVHGARRRIKRLRSLTRLLRRELGETSYEQINSALRRAADALAGQRRAEALAAVAKRLERSDKTRHFWRPLTETHRLHHEASVAPAEARAAASAAVAEAAAIFLQAPGTAEASGAAAAAMVKTYAKARKRLRQGLASGSPGELHDARKYVIHHLHHLSLLGGSSGKRLTGLEKLRQLLGDLNDLDELAQLAAQQPGPTPEEAAARLEKERKRLLKDCAQFYRRLFRHSPEAFGRQFAQAPA